MATKRSKASAPTDDELNKLLESIGDEETAAPAPTTKGVSKTTKPAAPATQIEQDLLAELDNLENLGAQPPSRPHTPRIQSIKRTATGTPPPQPTSTRTSEEKASGPRPSGDSTRSFHTSFTPSATSSDLQEAEKKTPIAQPAEEAPAASTGGGWWGSVFATASAAVTTASAAVKEIQQNEEAKRWAEQVKGNVGVLRGFGGELRSRALPTFTNILHTLAPPISSHERLQIHITHDFIGYPSLDPLIYSTFSRVMAQVEGGDLLVIQRGQESTARPNSEAGYSGSGGLAGWSDGPWWRQGNEHRDLGSVKGMVEGTKLVRVSAESYASEYFASHGGLEAAAQRATENLSESNPVRSSDIFLAVQAISHDAPEELFQGGSAKKDESGAVVEEAEKADDLVSFALYLHDPVHSITFHTISQAVPAKWMRWLDAPSPMTPASPVSPSKEQAGFFNHVEGDTYNSSTSNMPDEIAEIIDGGGVDPREWVAEWVEEILTLATGVVAQRYVARRMGVGEGGIGKGKARQEEVLDDGGGEAARAGLF
ncbi:related to D.melanogaster troponin T and human nucleolin [Rhynchosporium graminicola]|uniref:Related to D.melanogaster troponin T and human nucleolin n=1 Tax=Rhynchosporium graminicola TaxID=2792576 RepID=A0A1E1KBN8_9HELO|nr:related to D.melanogaster troponin T and human nucleolin [Rhynchosporium commune]